MLRALLVPLRGLDDLNPCEEIDVTKSTGQRPYRENPGIPESTYEQAVLAYEAGGSAMMVADQFGISASSLIRRLQAAGVPVRSKADIARMKADQEDAAFLAEYPEAIRRYEGGEPALWLAKEFGIGYKRFITLIARAGVQQRTVRENLAIMYAGMTDEQRREVASAAHAAKRGRPANLMSMERRAQTMERTMQLASRFDLLLGMWLAQRGVAFTAQKAAGRYNLDLALSDSLVAVEVNGSGHGTMGEKWAARCEFLFGEGWRIIEVRVKGPISALRPDCADKVAALAGQVPAWGRYTVIDGGGADLPDYNEKRRGLLTQGPAATAA